MPIRKHGYITEWIYCHESELRKLNEYKANLCALCGEGVLTEHRLARETHGHQSSSILNTIGDADIKIKRVNGKSIRPKNQS